MPTQFISTIKPSGQSGDYSSLNAWEAGQQNDLTTGNILVFGGSGIGSGINWANVTLYTGGSSALVSGVGFVNSYANQILVRGITNSGFAFASGDQWRLNTATGNLFTIYDSGDSPIATAKIEGNWSSTVDATNLAINGWTTSSGNYINIYTDANNQPLGFWDVSKYRMMSHNTVLITINEDFVNIRGLQIGITGTSSLNQGGIFYRTQPLIWNCTVDSCIFSGYTGNTYSYHDAIQVYSTNTNGLLTIKNCIAFDFSASPAGGGFSIWTATGEAYNCTVYNCAHGFNRRGATMKVVNCVAQQCATGFYSTFASGSTHNCSNLSGDAPTGANNYYPITGVVQFMNAAAGDFRLSPYDTGVILKGTGLSSLFTTDIAGTNRGTGTVWDIGAYHAPEYIRTIKPAGQSGSYTSLNAWEAGEQRDLTLVNKTISAEAAGNWSGTHDNASVSIMGWTTSQPNQIILRPDIYNRHLGQWDNNKYFLGEPNTAAFLNINEDYVNVSGLQISGEINDGTSSYPVYVGPVTSGSSNIVTQSCLIFTNHISGIISPLYYNSVSISGSIFNNIIFGSHINGYGIFFYGATNVFNNTVIGHWMGLRAVTEYTCSISNAYNNIFYNCGAIAPADWAYNRERINFNATDKASTLIVASSANDRVNQNFTFINSGIGDYRLSLNDTGALYQGTGLSHLFTTDAAGTERGLSGNNWSIGAFEGYYYVSADEFQFGIPYEDTISGTWVEVPLYPKVSGLAMDTTDWISSAMNPSNDTCEMKLSGIVNPNVYTGFLLKYGYQKANNNSGQIDLTIGLYQNTTLIASTGLVDIPYGWTSGVLPISEAEAQNISNYADLRIRLTANKV